MIKRLEDDQVRMQLQFEQNEWEHRRLEAEKWKAAINISDVGQTAEPQPQQDELLKKAGATQLREAGANNNKVVGSK